MNADAVLSLLGDLYLQIQAQQKDIEDLKSENAELKVAAVGTDAA